MTRVTVDLSESVHAEFRTTCFREHTTMAAVLQAAVDRYLASKPGAGETIVSRDSPAPKPPERQSEPHSAEPEPSPAAAPVPDAFTFLDAPPSAAPDFAQDDADSARPGQQASNVITAEQLARLQAAHGTH